MGLSVVTSLKYHGVNMYANKRRQEGSPRNTYRTGVLGAQRRGCGRADHGTSTHSKASAAARGIRGPRGPTWPGRGEQKQRPHVTADPERNVGPSASEILLVGTDSFEYK